MFHLLGYEEAVDTTANADLDAIVDDVVSRRNDHFIFEKDMMLHAACAMSATLVQANIASPSTRVIVNPQVRPIIVGALPPTDANVMLMINNPFRLKANEEIQMRVTAAPGATEPACGLLWVSEGLTAPPVGSVYAVPWTSTTAAVANAWTTATITWGATLPGGRYAICGSECFSTNGRAHRWIIPNQLHRPGTLSGASVGLRLPYPMSGPQFGTWGVFRSDILPEVQVLANGTDAAHTGYLYVVPVGNI